MKTNRMQKATLLRLVREKNLQIPNASQLKIGHLREAVDQKILVYLEEWFLQRVRSDLLPSLVGLSLPGRNKKYLPPTELEFDFSWKSLKVAVEIQGGIDSRGRQSGHVSADGMRRDMRKMCLAQAAGWIILQLPPEAIHTDLTWRTYSLPLLRHCLLTRQVANEANVHSINS